MKKFAFTLAAMLAFSAYAAPVGIASGQPTGTNYPMAEDIKKFCSTPSSPINNVVSDGSIANIDKIYSDKNSQYGIIQTDALVYMQGLDPKMMSRIVMVFPFFSTEAHLLVKENSNIKSLSDLEGKTVVEGPEGSGTWVSVQVVKKVTGIQWKTKLASQSDGFDQVMSGEADAEWIVAGKPISMLEKRKGYRLIPVNHPKLDSFALYTKTTISSGTYPGQTAAVSTFKVDNVLATYTFTSQYQKEIGDLVTCITKNIGKLQTEGHPKWRDVDPLDIDRIQWPAHPAAAAAIKRESKASKK